MASPKNTSASIPIESVPSSSAAPAVIHSPAAKNKELTVEELAAEIRRLDQFLMAVALLLTFFLASFTAYNSDIWMHLATGRLIAHGQYEFGADPFSYTSEPGRLWINHAWLGDLIVYGVSEMLGGPESSAAGAVLVAVKALSVVVLAGLMLLACRRGTSMWIPVVLVSLAVLAMSPRLLLQPRCVSFVFLGLTLYLLQRPRPADRTWPRHLFLLPMLFAVWVNLDSWFVLGPLTVALYLIGQLIQQTVASGKPIDGNPRPGESRQLAVILGAGLVACLVNPFHIRAFTLPEELWALSFARESLNAEQQLRGYLISPLKGEYMTPALGLNPAGLAYYALVVVGMASFFLLGRAFSWWRLLLWLVFALLSLTLARGIPYFAVIGGVIAALNWQDFAVHRFGIRPSLDPRRKNWSLLGRTLTLLTGLVLLFLAWPGWLKARSEQPRHAHRNHRVAWAIEVDPSLRAAARKLAELRAENVLTDADHGFNLAPDVANYCAWFCPQEKGFLDFRFPLFQRSMAAFTELRGSLLVNTDGSARSEDDWQTQFRDRSISHVILFAQGDTLPLIQRFATFPRRWVMLYADGRTAVFGWIDPKEPGLAERWRGHGVNLNRLAYAPNARPENGVPDAELEPGKAPDVPNPVSWWTRYAFGPPPRPLAVDEAALYRILFESTMRRRKILADGLALFTVFGQEFFPVGGPGQSILQRFHNLFLDRRQQAFQIADHLLRIQDTGPSPALWLANRAARQALAANPNDPDAYLELGLAYWHLFDTYERGRQYAPLQQLRQIQIITALQNAHTVRPDSPAIHGYLAQMYRQMFVEPLLKNLPQAQARTSFLDLEIEHLQQFVNLTRSAGPAEVISAKGVEREKPEDFAKRMESLEKDLKQREKAVDLQRRRNDYEVTTANKAPFEKAKRAVELGLVKQALDVLQEQPEPTEEGKELAIRLYLATGQVQPLLDPERTAIASDWNRFLLAAAVGSYSQANSNLEQIVHDKQRSFMRGLLQGVREQTFQAGLHPGTLFALIQAPSAHVNEANDWVLLGLLALEEGDTERAAKRFRNALDVAVWPTYRALVLTPLAATSPLEALLLQLETTVTRVRSPGSTARFETWPLAVGYSQLLRQAGHSP
jgi:tetratricopeptide (TPR) repeat protein